MIEEEDDKGEKQKKLGSWSQEVEEPNPQNMNETVTGLSQKLESLQKTVKAIV